MRWGLILSWAKDASAAGMINARSETTAAKPAFRDALRFRRCLVPADGFYEWSRTGNAKQPYCFEVNEGELFAFAGLWDRWKDARGDEVENCSILTTGPERGDLGSPRPHARHPRSGQLRPVARSGHEGGWCGVGAVEALRCTADAILCRKHADQPRGERRRGMFSTRGIRTDSESAILITP